jgi:hypothetical protein
LEIELAATEAKAKQLSEMAVQAAKRAKLAENKLRTSERTNKIATLTVSLLKTASKGYAVLCGCRDGDEVWLSRWR